MSCAARSLLVLVLFASCAWSSDWGALLKDQAIADFNEDDLREYLAAVYALLDTPMPAPPVKWSNPRTGAGAGMEVIGEPQIEGFAECRRVRTNVYSRKHKAVSRKWTACRDGDSSWRLVKGT